MGLNCKKDALSSDPHQNLHVRFNLPWEMADPKEG